jgi:predicted helicase
MAGSAPITQAVYVGSQASAYQQRIYNNASAIVRVGGSAPVLTPDPDALRSNQQQWVDFYQSYIQSFNARPIGSASDCGH